MMLMMLALQYRGDGGAGGTRPEVSGEQVGAPMAPMAPNQPYLQAAPGYASMLCMHIIIMHIS